MLRQLRRVDYLSTVSGGGYIGAWLLGLFKRMEGVTDDATTNFAAAKKFEESLRPPVSPLGELDTQASARPEHSAIRWLRQYSNYFPHGKMDFRSYGSCIHNNSCKC